MTISTPPTELGTVETPTGATNLTLTTVAAAAIGDIVYVVIGTTAAGVFPASFTDSAGNTYNATGSQLTGLGGGAANAATFWAKLTAALPLGGTIQPGIAHTLMIGASRLFGGLSLQQTQALTGAGLNPTITTGAFTQYENFVFVVCLEQNGATDTGYVEDSNITNDAIMAETDSLRWGWTVAVGNNAASFGPSFGSQTHWGLIADTFTSTPLRHRRGVSTKGGPASKPFVYDGYSPARLTIVGKHIYAPDGSEWQGRGLNHNQDVLVPGVAGNVSPVVDDMALTKAIGATLARVSMGWFNGNYAIGTFTGSIAGTVLTVTTAPTNPINTGELLIGGATLARTKVISLIAVNSDGTGTYRVSLSQTVTPAALTISPAYPCVDKNDSYNPNAPATGYIDPAHLTFLDNEIAAAVVQGLWIDLAIFGGNFSFWTDPAVSTQFQAMWAFLAGRYLNTPKMAFLEPLVEPHPTLNHYDNAATVALWRQTIATIRTVDTRTPFLVGAASTYNIRPIAQVYMAERSDVAYTFNWYELAGKTGGYVKQSKDDPLQLNGPWTGYPSNPVQGADPAFPWYQDTKGDQPNVAVIYAGRGQFICFNKSWMLVLLSCALNFRDSCNAPLFCQQIGIRTDMPGGLQWADDILSLFVQYGIGFAYWAWRVNPSGQVPPYGTNGDIGIIGQAVQGGPWIEKLGTGGYGDTWGNWAGMLGGHLTAPIQSP